MVLFLAFNFAGCGSTTTITDSSKMKDSYSSQYSVKKTEAVAKTCAILYDIAKEKDFNNELITDAYNGVIIPYLNEFANNPKDSTQRKIIEDIDKFAFGYSDYLKYSKYGASADKIKESKNRMDSSYNDLKQFFN